MPFNTCSTVISHKSLIRFRRNIGFFISFENKNALICFPYVHLIPGEIKENTNGSREVSFWVTFLINTSQELLLFTSPRGTHQ